VYEGGPLSYWALNDAVTVTLTLIR
jgi:hypothetical protein